MTGIYLIRNRITGQEYVGQSINIHRRWMEHKTPKANGNDRLHGDMKKYGIENFEFVVLEECPPDQYHLLERERHYIKARNPYYNTIGRERSEATRKNISDGTKRWWAQLPEETRSRIIKNNLKPPKKGHPVTEKNKESLRRSIRERQCIPVKIIETGEVFPSISDLEKHLGACTGTCAKYWSGKIKTVKGFHVEKCRD